MKKNYNINIEGNDYDYSVINKLKSSKKLRKEQYLKFKKPKYNE